MSFANSYNPSGELGVYAGTAQTNLNAVNQNLDPEENRNYEIGTNLTIAQGLQLRSAIFRTEKINQRINELHHRASPSWPASVASTASSSR